MLQYPSPVYHANIYYLYTVSKTLGDTLAERRGEIEGSGETLPFPLQSAQCVLSESNSGTLQMV